MTRPLFAGNTFGKLGLLDWQLVRDDSEEAREEIQRRVEFRRRNKMNLHGLAHEARDYEPAPDATILLLDDLGLELAIQERRRRKL